MITDVVIDGMPLDPALILADVTILHGRRNADDGPEASSATIVALHDETTLPTYSTGSVMELHGDTGPMFTGRVSDMLLEHGRSHSGQRYGVLTMTAAGAVAALGYRYVGDEPWPQESGAARAERILTLAEVPYLIDGAADAALLPRDVDSRSAGELLGDVAASTGAAVFDLPTGQVVYQPMSERARPCSTISVSSSRL